MIADNESLEDAGDSQNVVTDEAATRPRIVVGIGASAGGLEALESLFCEMPLDTEAAFIVVQHLSPRFESRMQELLSRVTQLPVVRLADNTPLKPNTIYLNSPLLDIHVEEDRLRLVETDPEHQYQPIDTFFTSLAAGFGPRAIAIVLSGTGSDGSQGICRISEQGGLVLVQDESTAGFDGMPRAAISTGVVDMVLPVGRMPVEINSFRRGGSEGESEVARSHATHGLEAIFQLLRQRHKLDFQQYKLTTINRRLQRRLELNHRKDMAAYLQQLQNDPAEVDALYRDLLIGVTEFFRDEQAFRVLEDRIIPQVFDAAGSEQAIRVWVAGCATGEEAYSLAILFDEEARRRNRRKTIKIFATDAHHSSLHFASRGLYSREAIAKVSDERRKRYFTMTQDGYQVDGELRRQIVFAPHNLLRDAPFTQMDLVTCRNLLIYLQPAAQQIGLSNLHFALRSHGYLFLGRSESTGDLGGAFETVDAGWRIFRKVGVNPLSICRGMPSSPRNAIELPRPRRIAAADNRVDAKLLEAYDHLLRSRMPMSVLVSPQYEIVHVFGGAESLLQVRGGRLSNSLLDAVHESIRGTLFAALQHVNLQQSAVAYSGVRVGQGPESQLFNLRVEPVGVTKGAVEKILVEFEPVKVFEGDADVEPQLAPGPADAAKIQQLERELTQTKESLQAALEEMETSNEELQASNEELVASNEELQSTNEELHSVNEELYSVNAEHQRRLEDLAEANADMDNLLASTKVGVIFLDRELRIRRFTPEIARIFNLLPQDVGRSITGFTHRLQHDRLIDIVRDVLESRRSTELEVNDQADNPFLLRIVPYRRVEEMEGVVLTLIDVKTLRQAQRGLELYRQMVESAADAIGLIDRSGKFQYANAAMYRLLDLSPETIENHSFFDLVLGLPRTEILARFRESTERSGITSLEVRSAGGRIIPVELTHTLLPSGDSQRIVISLRDISSRLTDLRQLRLNTQAIEAAFNGVVVVDMVAEDMPISFANAGFLDLTGYRIDEVLGRNCRFLQGNETDRSVVRQIRDAIAEGRHVRKIILNYRKDGTKFWNDLSLSPVFDDSGVLVNYIGIQNDITERMRTEDQLRQTAHRMSSILEAAAEGIFGFDIQSKCTFCNGSGLKLLGYKRDSEVLERTATEVFGFDLFQDIDFSEAAERGVHRVGLEFRRADGKLFPVEYWIRSLPERRNNPGFVISFQDISERLSLTNRAEQMGKLFEVSNDAIFFWHPDDGIERWNRGAVNMYGFQEIEVIGRQPELLLSSHTDQDASEIMNTLEHDGRWVGVVEQRDRRGNLVSVSASRQLITDSEGRRHILEIHRDISEQQRIAQQLEDARREALAANEAKSRFLANMSHELRTPMTAVLGFADILRTESQDAVLQGRVDTIKRNGEYLLSLLNDILDLSRIEAGKLKILFRTVVIGEFLDSVFALMKARADDANLLLSFDVDPNLPKEIETDPVRLRQILVNLLANAIKFTDAGSVNMQVQVQNDAQAESRKRLVFTVTDTGIGIAPENLPHLFEPFGEHATTSRGGAGLGLSISQRLAQEMNGIITAASRVGSGSTFTLSLPLELPQANNRDDGGLSTEESVSGDAIPTIPYRILLTDDRPDVWHVSKFFLERYGGSVTIAEDGQQSINATLEAIRSNRPFDIILMDMQMPVMDGRTAVAKLRKSGIKTPIIALTADAMDQHRNECLAIGCNDYVSKPIDGFALVRTIERTVNAARRAQPVDTAGSDQPPTGEKGRG